MATVEQVIADLEKAQRLIGEVSMAVNRLELASVAMQEAAGQLRRLTEERDHYMQRWNEASQAPGPVRDPHEMGG